METVMFYESARLYYVCVIQIEHVEGQLNLVCINEFTMTISKSSLNSSVHCNTI